jgi:hypothetical protein
MEWWTVLIFGSVVWWLWPKLFGGEPPKTLRDAIKPGTPSLEELEQTAAQADPSASEAFRAMERVRDRMVEVGAASNEIEQLTSLAPILLRVPSPEESEV